MTAIPPAPATEPRGALSPSLAAQLDRLSDRGRQDRILSELGILNDAQVAHQNGRNDDQLALFTQSDDGETFVAHDGQTL